MVSVGELTIFGAAKYEAANDPCKFMLIGMTHNHAKGDACWVEFYRIWKV